MRLTTFLSFSLLGVALLGLGGCASSSGKKWAPAQSIARIPRGYHPLDVRNACFVESVHFCDFYQARQLGGPDGWAKVLQWGNRKDDYTIKGGHAVAVYQAKNRLWVHDINYGFLSLAAPVTSRNDLTEVAPQIVAKYPEMKAALVRYEDELPQSPEKNPPDYTKGATTQELHDALRVAIELGRFRPVRVVEFIAPQEAYLRPYAATLFRYGGKLCIYSPSNGTRVVAASLAGIEDLNTARALVMASFPDAQDVKWFQPAQAVVLR